MIPNKIYWMLGYNNLALILEQERRHWLMKTDKNKQIQDSLTGDIFKGTLDNLGSDIIIESKKLPIKNAFISDITFALENVDKILDINSSVFPQSASVNGLMFARIISTNYPYTMSENDSTLRKNHYKIKFLNAEECIIPFGTSTTSNEVYAGKWIKTNTAPILMILDESSGQYTIERPLAFNDNITNVTWYYPLNKTLQPFDIETFDGVSTYTLEAVNNNAYIGYPLYWFTCDQTNIGSNLSFTNNTNVRNEQILFIGNEGNVSPFNAKIYTSIDGSVDTEGHCDATPDGSSSNNFVIRCFTNGRFNNTNEDFNKDINNTIKFINTGEQTEFEIKLECSENTKVRMSKHPEWHYIDESTYEIYMDYFDQNCLSAFNNPLISIFDVYFDETVPFINSTTDVGLAGIRMSAANPSSDVNERYPLNLNKWEGLPDWLNNIKEGMIPEHLAVYAFHQPPTYNPNDPSTMQGAGLLFDPGRHKTDDEEIPNTIGRVYVLSNDGIEYSNNATEEYPKPARTAARICDIPTSVAQLANLKGLHEFPIVDNKYVRTEANFSESDKDRLYNKLASRWVRPTALNSDGIPVYIANTFDNKFAFEVNYIPATKDSPARMENFLNNVDMVYHNDFREMVNLNPKVDVSKVQICAITNKGTGYAINDTGVCVVGGYSFSYAISRVSDDGRGLVEEVVLGPDSRTGFINLSNFNIDKGTAGITSEYGTSRAGGNGTGLKFTLKIDYDYYQTILPKKGEIFDDLFALVNERDGLYVYSYDINEDSRFSPKRGEWVRKMRIAEYDRSNTSKAAGLSIRDTLMNLTIPSIRKLPSILKQNHKDPVLLKLLQTGTFVNIIDDRYSPVIPARPSSESHEIDDNVVDISKFYCPGLITFNAYTRSTESALKAIKESNLYRYNSYVIWRWKDNTSNTLEAGVVYRGFNNSFTTNSSTLLPKNELVCNNYVDTNSNTTIVWNVKGIGMMVWIYDPHYRYKEDYYIDQATMDLHVSRTLMSYKDIDIYENTDTKIIDDDGKYLFNIATNNPVSISVDNSKIIYQQPELTQLDDAEIDNKESDTAENHKLCGNWRLILPRVNSFTLQNDETKTQWIPMKMQIIKGVTGTDIGTITDSNGNDVSTKSIVINESTEGISLNMFNQDTGEWEKI